MAIVTGPTSLAEWQALILEAEKNCSVNLDEETESYLVFLLMRFTEKPEMAASILGMEFLQIMANTRSNQEADLRDLGDKCLLYSGLFPGRAERRRVSIGYFVKLGRAAYQALSDQSEHLARVYYALCQKFVSLMEVLQSTRELAGKGSSLSPFQALSLWEEVRSPHALRVLQGRGQACLVLKKSHTIV